MESRLPFRAISYWTRLSSDLALRILHNPRYAGAYAYGRTKLRKSLSGGVSYSRRERDQWHALVKDVHSAYITWDEFEAIEERLAANARRDFCGPAREGCALLQGIVICGRCGKHFASSYKQKSKGERTPIYLCNREQLDYGKAICTSIPGAGINTIIAKVLLEKVTPVAVDAAISIQREIVKRTEQADRLLQLHVERAQYEANLARKRVMSVDPGNRLVAQTFEQEWNEKLTLLAQAKHDYESRRKTHQNVLEPARQAKIKQFVADFATVWSHQATTFQDKKRMIRLLIEDVTLKREGHEVDVYIRFKTGAIIKELFRIPRSGNKPTAIDPQIIEKIDHLSSEHTAGEIAKKLNEEGVIHPTLGKFDTNAIVYLLRRFNIQTRYKRLRAKGYLSQQELAEHCGVGTQTIQRWKRCGWINAKRYNDQPEYLYEPTLNALPANIAHQYSSILSVN